MKLHKFADKKKEIIATTIVSVVVVLVSVYVVFLVNRLTHKVYKVFGWAKDTDTGASQFNFALFEELGLRPPRATSTPVVAPPVVNPAATSASSS